MPALGERAASASRRPRWSGSRAAVATVGALGVVVHLDAAVVVEQHGAARSRVLGEGLDRAERHLRAGAARLDRRRAASRRRSPGRSRRAAGTATADREGRPGARRRSRRTPRRAGLRRWARPERTAAAAPGRASGRCWMARRQWVRRRVRRSEVVSVIDEAAGVTAAAGVARRLRHPAGGAASHAPRRKAMAFTKTTHPSHGTHELSQTRNTDYAARVRSVHKNDTTANRARQSCAVG